MTLLSCFAEPSAPVVMSLGEFTAYVAATFMVGAWVGLFLNAFLVNASRKQGGDQ